MLTKISSVNRYCSLVLPKLLRFVPEAFLCNTFPWLMTVCSTDRIQEILIWTDMQTLFSTTTSQSSEVKTTFIDKAGLLVAKILHLKATKRDLPICYFWNDLIQAEILIRVAFFISILWAQKICFLAHSWFWIAP